MWVLWVVVVHLPVVTAAHGAAPVWPWPHTYEAQQLAMCVRAHAHAQHPAADLQAVVERVGDVVQVLRRRTAAQSDEAIALVFQGVLWYHAAAADVQGLQLR